MILEMMPKPEKPSDKYKFSWMDCVITVGSATLAMYIFWKALLAAIISLGWIWGLLMVIGVVLAVWRVVW